MRAQATRWFLSLRTLLVSAPSQPWIFCLRRVGLTIKAKGNCRGQLHQINRPDGWRWVRRSSSRITGRGRFCRIVRRILAPTRSKLVKGDVFVKRVAPVPRLPPNSGATCEEVRFSTSIDKSKNLWRESRNLMPRVSTVSSLVSSTGLDLVRLSLSATCTADQSSVFFLHSKLWRRFSFKTLE